MRIILFGATGMVGQGVLRQCLLDPGIESVLSIGRRASGVSHPKFREVIRQDLFDFSAPVADLGTYDSCLFCLGVSSVGMTESQYTTLTHDLTLGWARTLAAHNPLLRFLYVSGMGAQGKAMWARVKRRTETDLLALLAASVMIRLGALRPMHGEGSSTAKGRLLLRLLAPLWPLLQWAWPSGVITTEELGRAMILAARGLSPKPILESADLVKLGGR